MRGALWAVTAAAASSLTIGAVATAAYAHARHYVLRRRSVLIPRSSNFSGTPGLRILHLSDLHALARHKKLLDFTNHLTMIDPDFVVLTGDLIAHDAAIEPVIRALSVFKGIPGVFVFGSNDYYAPRFRNPLRYLMKNSHETRGENRHEDAHDDKRQRLATASLSAGLTELGFINLNNVRTTVHTEHCTITAIGVNDAHIDLDHYPDAQPDFLTSNLQMRDFLTPHLRDERRHDENADSGGKDSRAKDAAESNADGAAGDGADDVTKGGVPHLKIGVTHAPYSRILNRMASEGCELIFAGHTHGGQICLPGHRALVTNCDLPAQFASGMFAWPPNELPPIKKNGAVLVADTTAAQTPDHLHQAADRQLTSQEPQAAPVTQATSFSSTASPSWVNLSAGLGTTPFVPLRTWCAPEAIQVDVINM
ncbi:MAG: metallophosphoesterase [Actinomycetaceae bacterium]|nr:metallophosphoesterase [Arcanobacterium sp.]MDD7687610.1 metallophosphoesterase [Actinomycetaceae bacterium]MDY5273152.1 metallophosphoesterase [Arcanobacterium sp.]